MRNYRPSKGETAHYTSLEQMRDALDIPKMQKRSKNKDKLEADQSKFLGVCRSCGKSLHYISGTNILVCNNESCKGRKLQPKSTEANSETTDEKYVPVMRILNEKGTEIAENLFG